MLKLIAALSMLIDHIGASFFEEQILWRMIGRIAFPIFCYHIALGFRHTHNLKKYILRILIAALVSQPPFYFLFHGGLNVCFTFLLSLLALLLYEHTKKNKKYLLLSFLGIIGIFISASLLNTDYSTYGVAMVLIFYAFFDQKKHIAIFLILLNINAAFTNPIQTLSLLALPIIFYLPAYKVRLPRYFFYVFYPAHLMVLWLIQRLLL